MTYKVNKKKNKNEEEDGGFFALFFFTFLILAAVIVAFIGSLLNEPSNEITYDLQVQEIEEEGIMLDYQEICNNTENMFDDFGNPLNFWSDCFCPEQFSSAYEWFCYDISPEVDWDLFNLTPIAADFLYVAEDKKNEEELIITDNNSVFIPLYSVPSSSLELGYCEQWAETFEWLRCPDLEDTESRWPWLRTSTGLSVPGSSSTDNFSEVLNSMDLTRAGEYTVYYTVSYPLENGESVFINARTNIINPVYSYVATDEFQYFIPGELYVGNIPPVNEYVNYIDNVVATFNGQDISLTRLIEGGNYEAFMILDYPIDDHFVRITFAYVYDICDVDVAEYQLINDGYREIETHQFEMVREETYSKIIYRINFSDNVVVVEISK